MNSDENRDALWEMLGRSPLQEPDGWFVARVLARHRHEQANRKPWWSVACWRLPRWAWAGAFVCMMSLTTFVALERHHAWETAQNHKAFDLMLANLDAEDEEWSNSNF